MMIIPALLWLYIGALVAVYLSPGPDMALIIMVSLSKGRRAGLSTAWGIATARALHVVGSGVGIATFIAAQPSIERIIRAAGAVYLLHWGWKLIRSPLTVKRKVYLSQRSGDDFSRGLITNLLNPKALLFCSMLLPQFISTQTNIVPQYILLGTILVCVGLVFDMVYVYFSAGILKHLSHLPHEESCISRNLGKVRNALIIIVFGAMALRLLIGL